MSSSTQPVQIVIVNSNMQEESKIKLIEELIRAQTTRDLENLSTPDSRPIHDQDTILAQGLVDAAVQGKMS